MKGFLFIQKRFLPLLLLGWVWNCETPSKHPNVIIIMADDQGWGDLSVHGNQDINTPNIDALAETGAAFENFYVSPVCSPTRAALLTGRYHFRTGVYGTSAGGERLNLDEQTIGEVFEEAGYRTALYGKWHSGMQYPYHPNARGFQDFYGFCSGHWGNYFAPELEANGQWVEGKGYITDDITQHALDFIEQNQQNPFFLYLSLNTPHSPMQVPDSYWEAFKDKALFHQQSVRDSLHTRAALAMVANIDDNVARLSAQLKKLQLEENTIVVYLSDNGPNGHRWNAEMKGIKGSTDEGGTRSPLFVKWKNKISPKKVNQLAGAIDLLPTLTALTGIDHQPKKLLDGINLSDFILDSNAVPKQRMLVSYWRSKMSVRSQNYRLDAQNNLFNIQKDRAQKLPLDTLVHATAYEPLRATKQKFQALEFPSKTTDQRPFPVGHPDFIWTELPARDALLEGSVQRSNRHPNCTFITNWSSLEDKVIWPVEVLASGTFQVDLFYSCAKENVGTKMSLTFNQAQLTGQVLEAHDPPLVGASLDRSPRIESYTKTFKKMTLGTLTLKEGKGQMILQAAQIPGTAALDLRRLVFKRLN